MITKYLNIVIWNIHFALFLSRFIRKSIGKEFFYLSLSLQKINIIGESK